VSPRALSAVDGLTTAEVTRILGIPPARIRELVRGGLCRPLRSGRSYRFRFQDVVVLRAAHELMRKRVPAARVRRALAQLVRELPDARPVSGLRIFADGRHVAVRDGDTSWQPETGQVLLDFDVQSLADKVAEIRDAPRAQERRRAAARDQLDAAIELEDADARGARRAYQRALELDPGLVDAYVNLGRLAHEGGDAREALRLYTQALSLAPDDALIHFNMAVALEDVQGTSPALSHYQRALELDPSFADAHYNLAGLYEQLGRETDALRHYHAYKKLTGRPR
jgi:tetratricopeptide (TPR) repeat protein